MIYGNPDFNILIYELISKSKRHDLYDVTVELAEEMSVHIYGDKPLEILNRTRPREPEEVAQYRIDNYEATTKATAGKGLSIVSKIFNPWISEIKWNDQTTNGKKLEDYTLQNYPVHNSIIKLMAEAGLKKMIADANGLIGIRPKTAPKDQLQVAEPLIYLYGSKSIWWYDNDCYVINTGKYNDSKGDIYQFTYYDKTNVIDFEAQIVNAEDLSISVTFFYAHGAPSIPAWNLQGEIETNDEGETYYNSFFNPAVPFWNLAITHESDLFASYISHMFPQKVELTAECDYVYEDQRCDMGKIQLPTGKIKTCPGCSGTGYKRATGPYGVYQVATDKLQGTQTGGMQPVQYVTVPVEPTKMLEIRADRLHEKGLEALNMDVVNKIGENQSGISKVYDRSELFDFLYKIASVVYGTHLTNIFYYFNIYLNGVVDSNPTRDLEANLPEVNTPAKFDILSTAELTLDYKNAKESEVNPEYLRQKQIAIVTKEFANTPDLKKRIATTIELDPLPGLTVEEADSLVVSGIISKRDAVLHFQMGKFITMALLNDKGFYNLDKQVQIDTLNGYADTFILENKPVVDTTGLYANATGGSN